MDWENVTKIHTPPICQTLHPPDEHALYEDNFAAGNGEIGKVIADMKTAAQDCCPLLFADKSTIKHAT